MKAIRNVKDALADARKHEQVGHLDAAAELYQQMVDEDPANRDAVRRLLMVYRRVKQYSKELSVVETALGAIGQRDKETRNTWLAAHPEAAKLGKAMLK